MKIGDEVYIHGYVDEIRNDAIIIRNKGGYFGTVPEEIVPSVQPEQHGRIFQEIVVEYPSISIYPEYEGKPYFSIKYIEDGQGYIGYGTYNPEVLSEYMKKYFIPSAEPERKKGKWIYSDDDDRLYDSYFCSCCHRHITVDAERKCDIGFIIDDFDFCPYCGADMRGEEDG